MKQLMAYFIIIVILASCCKAECIKTPTLLVDFQNLKGRDTDSVYFFRYNKGTGVQTDSSFHLKTVTDTTLYSRVWFELTPDSDYKIRNSSLNQEYLITDLQIESGSCSCGPGDYKVVSSYKVNNQQRQGSYFIVR